MDPILFRPSSLGRRLLCPGSARLEEGLPDRPNEDSLEGELLHFAIHSDARNRELNDEQLEMVTKCKVFRDKLIEDLRDLPVTEPEYSKREVTVYHEFKIRLNLPNRKAVEGTADCALLPWHTDAMAVVLDWKFGRAEPSEAAVTLQLAGYCLGIHDYLTHYKRVIGIAYYPRLERKYQIEVTDFEEVRSKIERVVANCEAEGAPLHPSDEACRHCRAIVSCPAVRRGLEIQKTKPTLAITSEEIAKGLEFCTIFETWKESFKAYAKEALEHGLQVPGYDLVTRRGAAYISDPEEAHSALSSDISSEEMMSCVDVKLSRLKSILSEKWNLPRKEFDRRFEEVLGKSLSRKPDITYIAKVRRE